MSMISAARVAVLAAAAVAAFLMAGAAVEPAAAQGDACKGDVVTSTGRGKWRPFTRTKELEGNGAAMKDAVAAWEREAASTHGERFKLWSEAKDKTFDCQVTQGKVLSNLVACTISGRPCATAESGAPASADDDRPGRAKVSRANRDDDDDDDNDRVVRYGGQSWRYRQEMRRQDALANWRDRREERGFEREQGRQRRLQQARDRREEWGWDRTNTRERWLARERD
jgi:hypothetical protein